MRREFAKVIADFRPDLIHVNGSEYNYGWIISQVAPSVPTVLSIQGLLGPCAKVYFGGMRWRDLVRFRTLRDWIRMDGLIEQRWKMKRRARMEARILRRIESYHGPHLLGPGLCARDQSSGNLPPRTGTAAARSSSTRIGGPKTRRRTGFFPSREIIR